MSVAAEHVHLLVACPHCRQHLEPWRVATATAPPTSTPRTCRRRWVRTRPGHGPVPSVSSRHKVVAGVLGIFLGPFGVHRFYLGFIGIGLLQMFLTIITFGWAGIWGIIEGILCLTGQMRDVDGLPLRD
jgi:TM2 domain-containing membrane protein YozV